jgi:hypothetical protein
MMAEKTVKAPVKAPVKRKVLAKPAEQEHKHNEHCDHCPTSGPQIRYAWLARYGGEL